MTDGDRKPETEDRNRMSDFCFPASGFRSGEVRVMDVKELLQSYFSRLEEAELYARQGLKEEAAELMRELLGEVEASKLSEVDKRNLRSRIRSSLDVHGRAAGGGGAAADLDGPADLKDPAQAFAYGMALMDGQFWEDAIRQFRQVAVVGYHVLESWELCGDCAVQMEKWEDAIRFYEILYSNPHVGDEIKQRLLVKISKCSQNLRKQVSAARPPRSKAGSGGTGEPVVSGEGEAEAGGTESSTPVETATLDESIVGQLLGRQVESWKDPAGRSVTGKQYTYRVVNVLHVGITSLLVELERQETGERFAGQNMKAPFGSRLTPEVLARWIHTQLMADSPYLVRVHDLAHWKDSLFIVRESLPTSLDALLRKREGLPVPLAISLAYQVLEGLGDLHLHMGLDKEIRKLYHLDLRPSRLLLDEEKSLLKINNGGLWKVLEETNPDDTAMRRLPKAFLPYRAPEQFRPYLARRKPPVFTDIYLFGAVFYEMLTGSPAFGGSTYEEYEIQHCDQYISAPKVWRPEIPDDLNEIIMKCLENDPMKRWRSTTQVSLLLEKIVGRYAAGGGEESSCTRYMKRHRGLSQEQ